MKLTVVTQKPFSFAQTLTFMKRFPPCQAETIITDDSVTAAVSIGGRAWPFTLRGDHNLTLEVPDDAPRSIARRASDFIGATDDLAALYKAAEADPPFRTLVTSLYGLHQVRFLGLEEIAVYCVMMQRAPIAMATRLKRKFLERFGRPVTIGSATIRAMPELGELAKLDGEDIARAIGHRSKGQRIATVVRGVAAIGEDFLRTAKYADARDALLEIPGIGPFSAGAILLRGLGRVEQVPSLEMFATEARAVYGNTWDEAAVQRRYGEQIGYWSFYVKTGASRVVGR
ncbi:MAG: DNA-3-methyladenine glycosylase [Myxococcales bacterium]|nr:DNA-3-methyladenine glycosylase [Myxococcales bacterium]